MFLMYDIVSILHVSPQRKICEISVLFITLLSAKLHKQRLFQSLELKLYKDKCEQIKIYETNNFDVMHLDALGIQFS